MRKLRETNGKTESIKVTMQNMEILIENGSKSVANRHIKMLLEMLLLMIRWVLWHVRNIMLNPSPLLHPLGYRASSVITAFNVLVAMRPRYK